jgi:peptidoglycan hydrolase CwlO-like protein
MKRVFLFSCFPVFLFIFTFLLFRSSTLILADCPSEDYDCQIAEIQKEIDALKPAHEANKQELANLKKQLADLQSRLAGIGVQLEKLEASIFEREVNLGYQQEILAARVRSLYKKSQQYSPFLLFLASGNATELLRELSYRESVTNQDKLVITQISQELLELNEDKTTLERSQASLTTLQAQVNQQAEFLSGEVAKVESYLAELTSRQQQLLAQKFASMPVPLLAYTSLRGCSSDIGKDSGFSPRFGFFSYGVPNKTGLNQYGAKGRAEAGQSFEQILQAYYDNFQIVDYGTGFNITVNGTNEYGQTFNNETMNIEEYLKRIRLNGLVL